MKKLAKKFEMNTDAMGTMIFEQVAREDNVVIYKRSYMDNRFHSFEVFETKVIPKGNKLPGGKFVEESYEKYASSGQGGAYCKFISDKDENAAMDRAEQAMKKILALIANRESKSSSKSSGVYNLTTSDDLTDITAPKRKGRPSVVRPEVIFPSVNRWTMRDLMASNPEWNQPGLYTKVIVPGRSNGTIVEVAEIRNPSGKGKPSKIYATVTKQ